MARTITKRALDGYHKPSPIFSRTKLQKGKGIREKEGKEFFAVIDTETNEDFEKSSIGIPDGTMMSVGLVIAESDSLAAVKTYYGIDKLEAKKPAWEPAKRALYLQEYKPDREGTRIDIIKDVKEILAAYHVKQIYAYNGSFDKNHLKELSDFDWVDIMSLCTYKQMNKYLPSNLEAYKTGRVKSGYKVDDILGYIHDASHEHEKHNALSDAEDELFIMQKIGQPLKAYAEISEKRKKHVVTRTGGVKTRDTIKNTLKPRKVAPGGTVFCGEIRNIHDESIMCMDFELFGKEEQERCFLNQFHCAAYENLKGFLKNKKWVVVEGKRCSSYIDVEAVYSREEYEKVNRIRFSDRRLSVIDVRKYPYIEGTCNILSEKMNTFSLETTDGIVMCVLDSRLQNRGIRIKDGEHVRVMSFSASPEKFYVYVQAFLDVLNEKKKPIEKSGGTSAPSVEELACLEGQGLSTREIAEIYRVDTSTVQRWSEKVRAAVQG